MLSSLQLYSKGYPENDERQRDGNYSFTLLADPLLVPNDNSDLGATSSDPSTIEVSPYDALKSGTNSPTSQDTASCYLSSIPTMLQIDGFSTETIEIIMSSWRSGTLSQYQGVYKKWSEFCSKSKCAVSCHQFPLALSFLSDIFDDDMSYSYINTARTVLSSLVRDSGIRKKTNFTKVQGHLECQCGIQIHQRTKGSGRNPIEKLTQRLIFLLCLLSGQRCQTIPKRIL